jgi:hypothetical protein
MKKLMTVMRKKVMIKDEEEFIYEEGKDGRRAEQMSRSIELFTQQRLC